VSTSRTGSTALLRAFANHPDAVAVYQPIKDGCRDLGGTDEDYRVYEQHHPAFESHHGKVYVSKEVTAYAVRGTPVNVFRSDAEMARVRPVFLIRDPLGAWRSMRPLITEYTPNALDHFIAAFARLCEYRQRCKEIAPAAALTLTMECMAEHPETVLRRLCMHWGLRFVPQMLTWTTPIESNMWVPSFVHSYNARDPRVWSSVRQSTTITKHAVAPNAMPIDDEERRRIEAVLVPAYGRLAAACTRHFMM